MKCIGKKEIKIKWGRVATKLYQKQSQELHALCIEIINLKTKEIIAAHFIYREKDTPPSFLELCRTYF